MAPSKSKNVLHNDGICLMGRVSMWYHLSAKVLALRHNSNGFYGKLGIDEVPSNSKSDAFIYRMLVMISVGELASMWHHLKAKVMVSHNKSNGVNGQAGIGVRCGTIVWQKFYLQYKSTGLNAQAGIDMVPPKSKSFGFT